MFVTLLAHIIVALGVAALAALIVYIAFLSLKKLLGFIKEKLSKKIGNKVVIGNFKRVAQEAVKEAEKKKNAKSFAELQEMAEKEGVVIATVDENGQVNEEDIEIYQVDEIDSNIISQMDEDGVLVVSA